MKRARAAHPHGSDVESPFSGTKTFFADAATVEALSQATSDDSSVGSRSTVKSLKWGERAEEAEAAKEARKRRPDFDPEVMRKLQGRLQAATFGMRILWAHELGAGAGPAGEAGANS